MSGSSQRPIPRPPQQPAPLPGQRSKPSTYRFTDWASI